jgi:hypothetical protein
MNHHGRKICQGFFCPVALFYLCLEMSIDFYCGAIKLGIFDGQSNLLPQSLEKL